MVYICDQFRSISQEEKGQQICNDVLLMCEKEGVPWTNLPINRRQLKKITGRPEIGLVFGIPKKRVRSAVGWVIVVVVVVIIIIIITIIISIAAAVNQLCGFTY